MKKVVIIACGIGAFVVASAAASIIGTIVNGVIPHSKNDPAGVMEPSPEERAKKEWAATRAASGTTTATTKPTETKQEAKEEPKPEEQPVQQQGSPAPAPPPAPVIAAPSPPPRVTTGPGNLAEPERIPYYPPTQTGPGNLN
jgi:hypothetical protein